jgi:hypothetical protein
MEELLTLKELLHQGNITEALLIVEELEEMSKLVQQEEIIKHEVYRRRPCIPDFITRNIT